MPQRTRSRLKGVQPTQPVSRRRSRRHLASRASYREDELQRDGESTTGKSGHASTIFPTLETTFEPARASEQTQNITLPSKQHDEAIGSANFESPNPDLQGTCQPSATQKSDGESELGHIKITHFDFSKRLTKCSFAATYQFSENAYTMSRIVGTSTHQTTRQKLLIPGQIVRDNVQPSDTNYIEKQHPDGGLLIALGADLAPSAAVTSIITSVTAATTFLHCFLAAEAQWLRSCDHDMDPDIRFWKGIASRFNAHSHGYSIDAWLTARVIAVTLCGEPYKMQVQKQVSIEGLELSGLLSAIQDCRRMSHRRRRGHLKTARAFVSNIAGGDQIQKDVLGRKPQTLEDQKKLLEALATECAESGYSSKPEMSRLKMGLGASHRHKGPRPPLQAHANTLDLDDDARKEWVVGNTPRGLGVKGQKRNRGFKEQREQKRNRSQGGYPYTLENEGAEDWGDSPSLRYTAQDRRRLEQRVADLERMMQDSRRL
ncbi:hypothetical protein ONZ43_g4862 [Nemania bipapillata]|uniref:Uncharacterized protein n=1 Tax=Nemania bipapillata TaxID=110536 RepID=A0ACC2IHC8_9PEZI|nr:hypothetical protein ONZ43_g4862 [Nemania bipapillata]